MSNRSVYDVIGVGRAVYDFTVLLERYPHPDEKTEAVDRYEGGGSPVPTALCHLAHWGRKTLLCARVGADYLGERFIEDQRDWGVDTTGVIRKENERTPRAFLWVEKGDGKRTVVLDRDIAPLSSDELPYDALISCRSLLIDGWEAETALEAASIVRKAGGKVMLDAGNVRPHMDELIAVTDWIAVPRAFITSFYPEFDPVDAALDLRKRGVEIAVVTDGMHGCVAAWKDQVHSFSAFPVDVVDTTGAGDAFHAGLLHGLLQGWDRSYCVRWASAAAALSTTVLGGRGHLPTEKEIERILDDSKTAL